MNMKKCPPLGDNNERYLNLKYGHFNFLSLNTSKISTSSFGARQEKNAPFKRAHKTFFL